MDHKFPEPVEYKEGWPSCASEESSAYAVEKALPRITVITPSFSQGQYLEETIRSVLLQGYPNLEYMIIDGGSTDSSVEIIRKYEPWITYWVSEPDRGQAHAINKGFERCTGDLVGWINSDDLLLPGSLEKLAQAHLTHPDKVLLGDVLHFGQGIDSEILVKQKGVSFQGLALQPVSRSVFQQPGTFVPTSCIKSENLFLDESLRYVFDLDWMCRVLQKYDVHYLSEPIAKFRHHGESKSVGEKKSWLPELEEVFFRYREQAVQGENKPILARFELYRAAVRFGGMTWEPEIARQHLRRAVQIDPAVIFSFRFLELSLRSLIPYGLMMKLRSLYGRLNPMFRGRQ